MTLEELKLEFKRNEGEFLRFENIDTKRSDRCDLHAFIVLDEILPADENMIFASGRNKIFLDASPEELAAVCTPEFVLDLVRCGVIFDEETDRLAMFV